MNINHPILVLLLVLFSFSLHAQKDADPGTFPNIIKVNPISLAFGNINLTYERALNTSSSIQISANYWYKIFGTEVQGLGARLGYRFYITNRVKDAPEGFYAGPQVSINSLKERNSEESVSAIGVGAMLGYQWVFGSGVTLDLGAGPIYQFAKETTSGTSYEGFLPNISIAVGYNF